MIRDPRTDVIVNQSFFITADLGYATDKKDRFPYYLIVICCYSRYVWGAPLKNKTSAEVSKALEGILKSLLSMLWLKRQTIVLLTDSGMYGLITRSRRVIYSLNL